MTAAAALANTAPATTSHLVIDLIVPRRQLWRWHLELARRLRRSGHDVLLVEGDFSGRSSPMKHAVLGVNNLIPRLGGVLTTAATAALAQRPREASDLTIELGALAREPAAAGPTLSLAFNNSRSPFAALRILAEGKLPAVEALLDGHIVGRALPMVNRRSLIGRGFDDVLARTLTLVEKSVATIASGRPLAPLASAANDVPTRNLLAAYLTSTLPRLAGEMLRLATHRHAHWRVGYRLSNPARAPLDGRLGGGWQVLADDGNHFYADPFAFEHEGRRHVFVEDYDHRTRKACISVFEVRDDGSATTPRPVLVEPHHLSYPNVFARDGAIWMIPESSSAKELVLYRAASFPDVWTRHSVLVAGREICDATLLEHRGRLYLFATDRDGFGSTSDVMVVYSADRLEGPWAPHPQNPILIDRTMARPGGAFVRHGADLYLPVQDGTECYGGGLGRAPRTPRSAQHGASASPVPLQTAQDWPHPLIHTYNSTGRLEVIDGLAPRERWRGTRDR
jgi:hypothetical protein